MRLLLAAGLLLLAQPALAQIGDRERAAQEKAEAEKRAKEEASEARSKAEEEAARRGPRSDKEPYRVGPHNLPLFDQAQALERGGKGAEAVKLYVRAAKSGSGKAAKRLGQIYDKGIPGVPRDYRESLKWFNAARVMGEDVPATPSQTEQRQREQAEAVRREAQRRAEEEGKEKR